MTIVAIIFPLLALAFIGYFSVYLKILNKEQLSGVNQFTFKLAIPAFLFSSMATADFSQSISVGFFSSFYLAVITIYVVAGIGYSLAKRTASQRQFSQSKTSASYAVNCSVLSLASSYSNTIIVGLPVLISAFGDKVTAHVFLLISFHSALLFSLTTLQSAFGQASQNTNQGSAKTLLSAITKNVFANPLTVSLALGLLVNFTEITLPTALMETIKLLGKPAMPMALFVLGASLYFYKLSKGVTKVIFTVSLKLIALPLLGFCLATYYFALDSFLTSIVVLLLASPTGVNAYLIACNQQSEQQTVANTVFISTILATISIPIWLNVLS